MKLVIVTGMSGAGKSTSLKMLEDLGYYCVDNLPVMLISKFAELAFAPNSELSKVAVGIDVRTGLDNINLALNALSEQGNAYDILFLDAEDDVLVKRFKETRRAHPLTAHGRIEEGISRERGMLKWLKQHATCIIDTSHMLTRELKTEIGDIYSKNKNYGNLFITVLSFGYKYGIPNDADLVFDVRFLPNPYYIDELKMHTGNDKEVQDYVLQFSEAGTFLDKLEDMIRFLIPNYVIEGKNQLVIAIGCTGGKHRSVTLANKLYERLEKNANYGIKIEHRDIYKDSLRR
ncbi:MAG: RNase adapter RapZ [Lachnospiraceae bacterium]|nr:RNase adapter RapZ [Lachnospiraceae bacterium]